MNNITIRVIHEAQCNPCGQIKRSPHHAVVEGWAEDHKCQEGKQYSSVFDNNEAAYDPHRHAMRKLVSRDPRKPYSGA